MFIALVMTIKQLTKCRMKRLNMTHVSVYILWICNCTYYMNVYIKWTQKHTHTHIDYHWTSFRNFDTFLVARSDIVQMLKGSTDSATIISISTVISHVNLSYPVPCWKRMLMPGEENQPLGTIVSWLLKIDRLIDWLS